MKVVANALKDVCGDSFVGIGIRRAVAGAGIAVYAGGNILGGAALGAGYVLTNIAVHTLDLGVDALNEQILPEDLGKLLRIVEGCGAGYAVSRLTGCGLLGVPALVATVYMNRQALGEMCESLVGDKFSLTRDCIVWTIVKSIEAVAYTLAMKAAVVAAVKFGVMSASLAASLPLSAPFGVAMGIIGVGVVFGQVLGGKSYLSEPAKNLIFSC